MQNKTIRVNLIVVVRDRFHTDTISHETEKGGTMVDFQALEIELQNARQARINAELACCDIEELTEEIRQSHCAFMQLIAERRAFRLH